ncbi:ABC transporter substrate-binding protein [Treponema denticola]|uniref:ABC transporter substrate-binding protein n=1 Tax=Treponema denticola TaxID=158 RepID=UPI0020A47785|nr:ABC transporter substrate-binding protein [Treponema denticola]UTC82084.1 ABC transporter substrate-binding protein [Treponema denticola]
MKKLIVLIVTLLLAFSLIACGGNGAATTKTNERPFVVASADFNGDFHAGWTNSSYDAAIRDLVWAFGLVVDTPKGQLVDSPLVAEKKVSDDLKTWTFKLVKGAKFHNGETLTASDVKFTYEFYMDTKALGDTGASSTINDYIDTIEVDEASNTVIFHLKKANYTVDQDVFGYFLFAEDTIKKGAKEEGLTVQQYVKKNISKPIGYGPYKIAEYKEGEYVKLEAYKDYLGKAPAIKEVIVKVVPSETEVDQLIQGEVDMLTYQGQAEKIDAVKDKPGFAYNNYYRHGGGTIALHCNFGPTALTEVRQAFAYVLNRPKIIELFLGKYGIASNGPYSKNNWSLWDDDEENLIGTAAVGRFESTLINYDILDKDGKFDEAANIAKAQELLDKAAARTDGDYAKLTGNAKTGYLWEGKPLDIKITYSPQWADTYNLIFNDTYVSKFGFKVSLTGLDWPVLYGHWSGNTQEERTYHAFVGGLSYALKSNPKSSYSTSLIKPWGQPSTNNIMFSGGSTYTPAEWDQLLDSIENAHPVTGKNEYRTNWRKYITVMNKEVPIIPVYSNNYFDLFTDKLENFHTNALWKWQRALPEANWKK